MRIYLAAPLFTTGERDFNDAIGARLREAGHEVGLPQDHEHDAFDPARTFRRDVDQVDRSDVVVGIDRRAGPRQRHRLGDRLRVCEGKPIILLRTDFREWGGRTGEAPYNLMLTESATERIELAAPTVDAAARAPGSRRSSASQAGRAMPVSRPR